MANQGRPTLGKVRVTLTMTPDGRDQAFALAQARGMSIGVLFEELLRQELHRAAVEENTRRSF